MKTQQGVPSQPSRLEAFEVGSTTIKLRYSALPIGRQLAKTAFPSLPIGLLAGRNSVRQFIRCPCATSHCSRHQAQILRHFDWAAVSDDPDSKPSYWSVLASHNSARQFIRFPCAPFQLLRIRITLMHIQIMIRPFTLMRVWNLTFHFDGDPDPSFHNNVNPDSHESDAILQRWPTHTPTTVLV